jgi:glycosyltransferase involved in cell wall biosynthesis
MKVAYFGTWERGYPRNEQVIAAMKRAGIDVVELHEQLWADEHKFAVGPRAFPRVVAAEVRLARRRIPRDVEALTIGYPGHFDIWPARRRRLPLVFNAMVSLYDTLVEDRHRFRRRSAVARMLRAADTAALRAVDAVVADTNANAKYLSELAGIQTPDVCYVGAEERLFQPLWHRPQTFTALFIGKLIPLHGLPVILDAARLLPDIAFRIVGTGQEERFLERRPPNVEHVPWIPYDRLPNEYATAGCALGVFGSSEKAQRVIPNKVFQALAVGTPVVTAATEGVRELLDDGHDALLVEASAEGIATAVRRLRDDARLATEIAASGRRTFEREASEDVLGARWRAIVERVVRCH